METAYDGYGNKIAENGKSSFLGEPVSPKNAIYAIKAQIARKAGYDYTVLDKSAQRSIVVLSDKSKAIYKFTIITKSNISRESVKPSSDIEVFQLLPSAADIVSTVFVGYKNRSAFYKIDGRYYEVAVTKMKCE